jgi:hypothetical protein
MRTSPTLLATLALALACGRARVRDLDNADSGTDAGTDAGSEAGSDAGSDGGADAGVTYSISRVALHVHSAISHDACDHHGTDGGPLATLDQDCLDQLEAALCASRIDVAFLTDHPRYMDDKSLPDDLLLRGRGEIPITDGQGNVTGMRLACGAQLSAGWEGTHTMPLGLVRLPSDDAAYGTHVDVNTTLAAEQAMVAAVHDAGGIVWTAHSEAPDISASNLQQLQTDGMEWYNVHGNFIALLGGQGDLVGGTFDLGSIGQLVDALKGLEPFLKGGHGAADLAYLPLLRAHFPEVGLQKWHQVLGARRVSAALGNDVHQNVSVKPLCKGALAMAACQVAAAAYPNVLTSLAAGGQLLLSDGERIDSYARVLRWLNNRALVKSPGIDGAREAMAHGRAYGVFAVLGEPGPVAFQARTASGDVLEMGDEGAAQGATLLVRLPDPPAPELGPRWTAADAARAQLHTLLWRTTAGGPELAAEWWQNSTRVEFAAPGPGHYSVEMRIVPRHLDGLGASLALVGSEYRWVLMNAIELR